MGRRISKEFLHPSILEGVNNKIGNLDSLETDAKGNMVQAINELVEKLDNSTEIENGKELIANAVGEPLTVEESFDEMSNDINGLLATFKANMMNNGVTVESGDKFKQLIDKITTLTDEDIIKNTRVIHGTTIGKTVRLDNGYDDIIVEVHGLPFEPICGYIHNSGLDNGYFIIYEGLKVCSTEKNADSLIIYEDGFRMPTDTTEFGRTYTYWAIGLGEDTTLRDSLADILENKGVDVTEEDDMASLITKIDGIKNTGLDLISATELPTTGVENQLCFITDTPTNKFIVTTDFNDISNVDNAITICSGTTSSNKLYQNVLVEFTNGNMTTKNYFNKIVQGDKRLATYIYRNNNWELLIPAKLAFIEDGTYVNFNFHGGLNDNQYSMLSYKQNGNPGMMLEGNTSTDYTIGTFTKKMNFDLYNFVDIRCYKYLNNTIRLSIISYPEVKNTSSSGDFTENANYYTSFTPTVHDAVYTLDISDWKGEGYFGFTAYTASDLHILDIVFY